MNSKGQIAVSDCYKDDILITDKEGNCVRKVGCYENSANKARVMDSSKSLSDCVFRNVAITIIFLFVIEPMAVLISLQWRAVSLEKLLLTYKPL